MAQNRRPTKPGTSKLSDVARHVVQPSGITSTGWPSVRDKCAELGIRFDDWQDGAGRLILAKRADGSYAASIGGVVISIPRQVGKTFLVGAIVFALCLLHPGLTVLWTAHHSATSEETFRKMQGFARRAKIKPHIAGTLKDAQTIEFVNGSRIMFGAREHGFGRGFDDVDIEVFDEAQILTDKALDDMVPATNTAANPLLFFLGTPPKPSDPSEVFERKRAAALSGDESDTAFIEFSADRGADPLDRAQWAKANPSFPRRTNEVAMLRMIKNLSADSVLREALGIWDEMAAKGVGLIDVDEWTSPALQIEPGAAPLTGAQAFGVKFSPDGATVAVSVALKPVGGVVHVEGVFHRPMLEGTRWLIDWLSTRWGGCTSIVVDGKAGAGAFVKGLRQAGCPVRKIVTPTADQAITAHREFLDAVINRTLTHIEDPALTDSVTAAGRRPIGNQGGFGFQSINDGDVTLAESAVFAHFGATNGRQPRTTSGNGRRAVVLT